MQSLRHQRVRELLKRAVGEIIRREIPVEQAGLITVNDIGVAGDLQSATVFVGVGGATDRQQQCLGLLRRNRMRIQGLLGRAVVLKYTPKLRFVLDDSVERGDRVLRILDDLERGLPSK